MENVECTNPCEKVNAVLGYEYTMKNPHNITKNKWNNDQKMGEKKLKVKTTYTYTHTTYQYLVSQNSYDGKITLNCDDQVQIRNSHC